MKAIVNEKIVNMQMRKKNQWVVLASAEQIIETISDG